jgi:hypothetical protein
MTTQPPDGLAALLAPLAPERRADLLVLDAAIRELEPSLVPVVRDGAIAYGRYEYRYASGHSGESGALTVAPRAAGISVYVGCTTVERWAARLPRASCGKGCIRLRRAADMEASVLEEIVAHARSIDGRRLDWKGRPQAGPPLIT